MNTIQRFSIRSPRDLARTLTEARLAREITQAAVASAAGIDRTYLSRMENGLATTQLERAFEVFRVLGVRIEAYLESEDE
jgi:transcriptional regulator with XRE-family HTH domain